MMNIRAGIALGSNMGNRLANLRQARDLVIERLSSSSSCISSPVYETEPVDCAEGASCFYNAVIEIETARPPGELLSQLRQIEQELGRLAERVRNASRTVDLDLLYAGEAMLEEPGLTLPHPRMHQRKFVLQPLADLHPDLILPGLKASVSELLKNLATGSQPGLVSTTW